MTVPEGLPKRAAKAMLEGRYAEAATLIASLESHAEQHAALDEVHALMERVAIDQSVDGRIDVDKAARGIEDIRSKLRASRPATVASGDDVGVRALRTLLRVGALAALVAVAWWVWSRG